MDLKHTKIFYLGREVDVYSPDIGFLSELNEILGQRKGTRKEQMLWENLYLKCKLTLKGNDKNESAGISPSRT